KALVEEISGDTRYSFSFEYVIDTAQAPSHQVIQHACRVAEEDDVTFLVVDLTDKAVSAALPIIYDAAFHKKQFALLDAADLYQEMFEREPLSFISYEWILGNISAARVYDLVKRGIDIVFCRIAGALSLVFY